MKHHPGLTTGNQPIEISSANMNRAPVNRAFGVRLSSLTIRAAVGVIRYRVVVHMTGDGQPIGYAVLHTANRTCFRTGDLVRCPEVFGEMGAGCAETCTSGSERARE